MPIRFVASLTAALAALVIFGIIADHIHSATSFAGAFLLTTAGALGVMYGVEWLARVVRRARKVRAA